MAIRHFCSGPSAPLKTTAIAVLLLIGAPLAGAQTSDGRSEATSHPPVVVATADSGQTGFHDLICKPNGSEDGFDCADQPTPAKIVPIPSQAHEIVRQDQAIIG